LCYCLWSAALKSLESLSLASTQLFSPLTPPTGTQADFYPNLRILDVSRTKIADEDVRRIVCGFGKLETLDMKGCAGVTAEGLGNVARCKFTRSEVVCGGKLLTGLPHIRPQR
jgi:hypothetical protein